jgi:hypothetical protein
MHMPRDEDDDLYDEDFDFVDDDDDEDEEVSDEAEEAAEEAEPPEEPVTERPRRGGRRPRTERPPEPRGESRDDDFGAGIADAEQAEEAVDEYGRPEPAPNYVVHIYEHKKLKRTIERPFTPEEAEAFATEYNRTAKSYGRFAMAGKNDSKPKKALD